MLNLNVGGNIKRKEFSHERNNRDRFFKRPSLWPFFYGDNPQDRSFIL